MTVTYSRVAVGTPARSAGAAEREPRVPAAACGAHAGTRDTTRAEAAASLPFCCPRSVNEWYQLRSHCGVGSARAAAVSARATRAEHDFPAVGLHQHVGWAAPAAVGCRPLPAAALRRRTASQPDAGSAPRGPVGPAAGEAEALPGAALASVCGGGTADRERPTQPKAGVRLLPDPRGRRSLTRMPRGHSVDLIY